MKGQPLAESLEEFAAQAEQNFRSARISSTLEAYSCDLQDVDSWCKIRHQHPLPLSTPQRELFVPSALLNG